MNAQKLRELDGTELAAKTAEIGEQMFRIRFQMELGQADGLKKLREIKKDRARILGILREREMDPAKGAAAETAAAAAKQKPARRGLFGRKTSGSKSTSSKSVAPKLTGKDK